MLQRKMTHASFKMYTEGTYVPPKLSKHTATEYEGSIFVVGGDAGNENSNRCFRFDLTTKKWTPQLLFPKYAPTSHISVLHKDTLFVHGTDCFFSYNFKTKKHINLMRKDSPEIYEHAGIIRNDILYLYGGLNTQAQISEKMWEISAKKPLSDRWQEVIPKGKVIPFRSNFVDCFYEELSQWIIFGGKTNDKYSNLLSFSFKTKKWNELLRCPYVPKHTEFIDATSQLFRNTFYIYGGHQCEGSITQNTMLGYSIDKNCWSQIYFSGIPPKLSNSTSIVMEDLFLTIGGEVIERYPN
eukprot:gene798-9048_t